MLRISSTARLITPQEAADLLRVSPHTISNWIKEGRVPYVELPGTDNRKSYRLPLGALIQSLSGNYDLLPHLEVVDDKTGKVSPNDEPFVTED
jgi:excisionase family DNA binding protein